MAKRRGSKPLETHIKELAAVVAESNICGACGKPIAADATTCPHCGTPVGEAAELHEKAEESLMDLEKQLAETAEGPAPKPPERGVPAVGGLESAAAVVAAVQASEPVPTPASIVPVAEIARERVPGPQAEVEDAAALEDFIEEIEAEVGPGEAVPLSPPRVASAARTPTVRAARRVAPSSRSGRWVAPVAAGLVVYFLAPFLLAFLERLVVASFMVIATFLVVGGISARPVSGARSKGVPGSRAADYVCPLCGTEIPVRATQCPTCGAVFED